MKRLIWVFVGALVVGFLFWLSTVFGTDVVVKDKECSREIGEESWTGSGGINAGEPYGCHITLKNPSGEDEYVRVDVRMRDSSGDLIGEVTYGTAVQAGGTSSGTATDEVKGNVSSVSVEITETSQEDFISGG